MTVPDMPAMGLVKDTLDDLDRRDERDDWRILK